MAEQIYSLIPFPDASIPAIEITACVGRERGLLHIEYGLTGEIGTIRLPAHSASPMRKDDLWANTCFEFFLALPDDPQYWEFNLSPSGDWNVYRMNAYRRVGFREEMSIQRLQLEAKQEAERVRVDASVDLSPLVADGRSIQLGISSVVQSMDHHRTYWALAHPHAEPDFHVRDSFIVRL